MSTPHSKSDLEKPAGPSGDDNAPGTAAGNAADNNADNVEKITLARMRPFFRGRPRIWFTQAEAMFARAGVRMDRTKVDEIICQLDSDILGAIEDFFERPRAEQTYDVLRERLIKEFSDSDTKQIQILLQELSLDDKKPSTLLREMKTLAGDRVTEGFLRNLWLQRLPRQMQAILSVHTGALGELSEQADRIAEVQGTQTVAAVMKRNQSPAPPNQDAIAKQLAELKRLIEGNAKAIAKLANATRSQSRGRSTERTGKGTPANPPTTDAQGLCYYHRNFGDQATKCRPPCSRQAQGN